ncbi:MAG: hypothetical protein EZS28_048442 [Streblomastix strix]|uniref:Uncharacterized protein n=1 Tax=Streblomastix strix TaxID=222440 RepID=A0A5J4TEI3_9EUKA|nr:MAG: hypothetical protein EZS28_048442 [Streblomastix strix]
MQYNTQGSNANSNTNPVSSTSQQVPSSSSTGTNSGEIFQQQQQQQQNQVPMNGFGSQTFINLSVEQITEICTTLGTDTNQQSAVPVCPELLNSLRGQLGLTPVDPPHPTSIVFNVRIRREQMQKK